MISSPKPTDLKRFVHKSGTLLGYLSLPTAITPIGRANDTALAAIGKASEEATEMRGEGRGQVRGQKGTLCPGGDD